MDLQVLNLEILTLLEDYIIVCNQFFSTFFGYLKYILSIILILLGIFTLLRYRGIYRTQKKMELGEKREKIPIKEKLGKAYVIVGMAYIFLGFGIIFNFLTYILFWCLDPLPDQYIIYIVDFLDIFESEDIIRVFDLVKTKNPFEEFIFYIIALFSLLAFMQVAISIWFITRDGTPLGNPMVTYLSLIAGIIEGILVGFTTCLPLFL